VSLDDRWDPFSASDTSLAPTIFVP